MDFQSKIPINLESLLDLSAKLNETYDEAFILNAVLFSLMGKLRVFRACILLPESDEGSTGEPSFYKIHTSKGRQEIEKVPYFEADSFRQLNILIKGEEQLFNSGYRHCLPVKYRDNKLAVICLGKRISSGKYSDEENQYANLVAAISVNALQNAKNHKKLESAKNNVEMRNQLLTTLFEVGRDFSALLSKSEILKMLSYRLMGQLMVSRFAVYLIDKSGSPELIINRFDKMLPGKVAKALSEIAKTISAGSAGIKSEIRLFVEDIKACVISPMKTQGAVKGLLLIGKKMNNDAYSEENILFIEALGNTAMAALENERLFYEELEKKKLENELTLALEIQKNLLPKTVPDIRGIELAGVSIPSQHVGGDYYDFIQLPDNKLMIAIADVAGKGISAALLMANVQATLRALSPLGLPLKEVINRMNHIIYQNTTPDRFITFFFGIFDAANKTFNYLNAGHNPPWLLKKNNSVSNLSEGGLILGIMENPLPYEEGSIALESGDILLLYTDGITEAQDKKGKEFGEDRLMKELSSLREKPALFIMKGIIEKINAFAGGIQQTDDITLVVLKTSNW